MLVSYCCGHSAPPGTIKAIRVSHRVESVDPSRADISFCKELDLLRLPQGDVLLELRLLDSVLLCLEILVRQVFELALKFLVLNCLSKKV